MAMFVGVDDGAAVPPPTHKVARPEAQDDGEEEPHVERHHDQHENVADGHLQQVQ